MSASSKKKLRKEQNTAAMTEKQQTEQKEAKTLKRYTLTFVIAMILVVAIAIGTFLRLPISGAIDRGSHAITVGGYELSTTDLSYYYIDAVNDHYNQAYQMYGGYAQYFLGFTTGKPLNQQSYTASEDFKTWADYFMDKGIKNAQTIYGLYIDALKNGHKLSEEEQKSLDSTTDNLKMMASYYGYSSANAYLRSFYSDSANTKTYNEYVKINTIANSYYNAHSDSLEYDDAALRAYEKDKYHNYSSFTYATYTITVKNYLEGDNKDSSGNVVYTDEQWEAARAKAKADAENLGGRSFLNVDSFNTAIRLLEINKKNTKAACTEVEDAFYSSISNEDLQKWLSDANREKKDVGTITVMETTTDKDGKKTDQVSSYIIVYFQGRNENKTNLVDVQHILIRFKEGKTDPTTGAVIYSDEQKNKAKLEAEKLLNEWKAGAATKESFAALAKEKSEDDGSKENGGLYEDIYPGQMVEAFNDWCFDEARKPGDTGLVETNYGWHVMYFVETNEVTYRDYLLEIDLRNDEMTEWNEGLTKTVTVEKIDLSRMEWDYKFG